MISPRRVVVIGAGIAGLTAAQRLAPLFDVVVVDKGRGVGGRLATRRIWNATFDHGAQFITTHTQAFSDMVSTWERAGVTTRWFSGRIGPSGIIDPDGHPRFRGVTSMNAIAKHLARGLDVRVGARVVLIKASGDTWRLGIDDGTDIEADAVVLTAPVPQALELLTTSNVSLSALDLAALQSITYDPCIAVMAALEGPSGLAEPGAVDPVEGSIDWMADNQLKGVSKVPAITIHATSDFTEKNWGAEDESVIDQLLQAAGLASPPISDHIGVQRWRFARPAVIHPQRCLLADGLAPLVFAGDAFGGAKVEGAALSGAAAADAIASVLGDRSTES